MNSDLKEKKQGWGEGKWVLRGCEDTVKSYGEALGAAEDAPTLILTPSLQDKEKYTFAVKSHPVCGILLRQLNLPDTDQEHVFASVHMMSKAGWSPASLGHCCPFHRARASGSKELIYLQVIYSKKS